MQHQEDMEQRLTPSLTPQTIQNIHQMRPLSGPVLLTQKDTQVLFSGQEIHNKNSQMKEQLDSRKE
jgi:hypothetical protein